MPATRNLIRFSNPRGAITIYQYQATPTPVWAKDNVAKVFRPKTVPTSAPTNNDPSGDTTNFTLPIMTTYSTDGLNRVATTTDARNNTQTFLYDVAGNLKQITYPTVTQADGSTQNTTESLSYDTQGRLISATDGESNTTTYQYTDAVTGLVTSITRPGSTSESFTYFTLGQPMTHTLPEGGQTSYAIDGMFRVTSETPPSTPAMNFGYDLDSNQTSATDPKGNSTTRAYDALGRLSQIIAPIGTSNFQCDREGNVRKSQDPNGNAGGYFSPKALYDEVNRPKERDIDGSGSSTVIQVTQLTYDLAGNKLTQVEQPGASQLMTSMTYDARNNRLVTTYPIATITDQSCYDDNDNFTLTQRRNTADSPAFKGGTALVYDERNRQKTSTSLMSDPGVT